MERMYKHDQLWCNHVAAVLCRSEAEVLAILSCAAYSGQADA